MGDALKQMNLGEDFPEIREAVSRICDDFPGEYWREMDAKSAYPEAFVSTLTESGWLSALIPESYGGSGLPLRAAAVILETIHASGVAPLRAMRRCTPWVLCLDMAATSRNRSICHRSQAAICVYRPSGLRNPLRALTPRVFVPGQYGMEIIMWSTAKKFGPAGHCIPT